MASCLAVFSSTVCALYQPGDKVMSMVQRVGLEGARAGAYFISLPVHINALSFWITDIPKCSIGWKAPWLGVAAAFSLRILPAGACLSSQVRLACSICAEHFA